MKKKILFALLLATSSLTPLAPTHAVQLGSQADEDEAIKQGRQAQNVCYLGLSAKNEGDEKFTYLAGGSGALIAPNIIATAAHVIFDGLDADNDMRKKFKPLIKQLKSGEPVPFYGLVTFASNVYEALTNTINLGQSENSSPDFYEIDSVIMHPTFDYDDGDEGTDIAFVKLKTPVLNIFPLSLYEEGVINPFGHHDEDSLDMTNLIHTTFTGYGNDISSRCGVKRTISQLCFFNKHVCFVNKHDDSESGSSSDSEGDSLSKDNTSENKPNVENLIHILESLDSDSDSETESSSDEKSNANTGDYIAITSYVPSLGEQLEVGVSKEHHEFHNALYKQKKEGEIYGLKWRGDSGGPLTVKNNQGKEFLIGIESTQGTAAKFRGFTMPQDIIRSFEDVRKVARSYESYLCPLFTKEEKLRPELPIMIEKLQNHKLSAASNLDELILEEKSTLDLVDQIFELTQKLNSFIVEFTELLDLDFSNKTLILDKIEKIEREYGYIQLDTNQKALIKDEPNQANFILWVNNIIMAWNEKRMSYINITPYLDESQTIDSLIHNQQAK